MPTNKIHVQTEWYKLKFRKNTDYRWFGFIGHKEQFYVFAIYYSHE